MKQQLKQTVLGFSFLVCSSALFAQIIHEDDANLQHYAAEEFSPAAAAQPFNDIRYAEALGSAYFDYQWEKGTIIMASGQAYTNVPVRIDLIAHRIHFKAEDGRELVVGAKVKEVKYQSGGKTVHFINGDFLPNKKQGWYRVLVNDAVSVVQTFKKSFEEKISFGKTELNIKTVENFTAYHKNTEYRLKKPADLAEILPAKKSEIEAELKKLKSASKEEQYIAIAKYISSQL